LNLETLCNFAKLQVGVYLTTILCYVWRLPK